MNIITIFVCHTEALVYECLGKYDDSVFIMLVGNNGVVRHPRVIIARELPHNIEHEPKLLTFTAWYAIIKNELFNNSDYVCIVEYDVNPLPTFFTSLENACKENDVVSFFIDSNHFLTDISFNVFNLFLQTKHIEIEYSQRTWYATTNHCMRRTILAEFVDWYYPDYTIIKELDSKKLSWYHERLFYLFVQSKKYKQTSIEGLNHYFVGSHNHTINSV